MTEDRKPQSADKYIVRFPEGMRARITEAAKANNRSMNAEIVHRLEASFSETAIDFTKLHASSPTKDGGLNTETLLEVLGKVTQQLHAISATTNILYAAASGELAKSSQDLGDPPWEHGFENSNELSDETNSKPAKKPKD